MSPRLHVDFEKAFRGGATVRAAFEQEESFRSTVLFGPSGSGKTTILRCVAGLERPDRGRIVFAGRTWFDADHGIDLPPQARNVGLLFQDFALFPHLTVERNVAYGCSRVGRAEARRRSVELLAALGLAGLERRYPRQLSAGQQQRVALARAVAPRPGLLLLDEPLSALDAPARLALRQELRRLLAEWKLPAVVVTHDTIEAVSLADHAVVLGEGRVLQSGPIQDVFSRPAGAGVARIVGVETIVPGVVREIRDGVARVLVGDVEISAVAGDDRTGAVFVCLRGEDVTLDRAEPQQTSARNRLPGRVIELVPEGPTVRVRADVGFEITALITRPAAEQLALAPGEPVVAVVKAQAIHLLPR